MIEFHARRLRAENCTVERDRRVAQVRVNAERIRLVGGYGIRNVIACVAVYIAVGRPTRLVRNVVGKLRLIEVRRSAFAVPHRLVFLKVLDEKPVEGSVIAVYDNSRIADVLILAYAVPMVGAPNPEVVAHDVIAVDYNADVNRRSRVLCAAYAEK